jgi:hypothetical protein
MRRLAAVILAGLVLAPAAAATGGPVFGLRAAGNPKLGYFVYKLAPGASKQGSVIVSNVGTASGTVKLFTADGTTGPTSGTVYETDSAPKATGAWVSLAKTSLTLAPGAHGTVPFTVHVPAGAKPGQWVAGIVAETSHKVASQKPGQKARVQIKIRDLTIVAVQVNVPGPPVIAFKIGGVTTGGTAGFQKVIVHVASAGNVLVKPRGSVTIYAKSGALVESLPFTMDTFLPQTAIDYPILLKKALAAGDYQALVRMTVPGVAGASTTTVSARPRFSVSNADVKQVFSSAQPTQAPPGSPPVASSSSGIPVWAYVAGAVLVALLLAALTALALGRRRPRTGPAAPTAPERSPEEITAPPPPPSPSGPLPPQPAPIAASDCEHEWEVAYDRGTVGEDGVWRFPHRCRNCGVELLARDVTDARERARP